MKFKSVLLATVFTVAACGGGGDGETAAPATTTSTARATTTSTTSLPRSTTTAASRCVDFPTATAEELISNSDTGERKIEGAISKSAAVRSKEKLGGRDLWFVSINVAGTIVTLAHDTPAGADPSGSGLYASIDSTSEKATSFPSTDRLKSKIGTDGAKESQGCVR